MNFGSKSFQPRPPDKGSFPLDHFGERREGGGSRAGASGPARLCGAAGGGASERLVRRGRGNTFVRRCRSLPTVNLGT